MSPAAQALQGRKAEIRIQFKSAPPLVGADADMAKLRNELVIRVQPNEAIYMKMVLKDPGLVMRPIVSELDLTYRVSPPPPPVDAAISLERLPMLACTDAEK